MATGIRLMGAGGKIGFSTEFRNYGYRGIFNPEQLEASTGNNYVISAIYAIPAFGSNDLYFGQNIHGGALAISAVRDNPFGYLNSYVDSNTGTSFTLRGVLENGVAPEARVGLTLRSSDLSTTAIVTGVAVTSPGVTTLTTNVTISLSAATPLRCVEYENTRTVRMSMRGGPVSTANVADYPLRVFSLVTQAATSGYGIQLFNAAGQILYSSKYPPLAVAALAKTIAGSSFGIGYPSIPLILGAVPENYAICSSTIGRGGYGFSSSENIFTEGIANGSLLGVGRLSSSELGVRAVCSAYTGVNSDYWNVFSDHLIMVIDADRYT